MQPNRIMIIENSEIQCRTLSRAFSKLDSTVLVATTGVDGFAQACLNHPDVIVLDLLLPDVEGFEVCERLKKNPSTQDIPVIMFSGRTRIADILRGFDAGADMFIGKGLSYEKLVNCIRATLAERKGNENGIDRELAMKTCQELLESLIAAFDGVVRSRLQTALGKTAAAMVIQKAAETLPEDWKIQPLQEGAGDYRAMRQSVLQFKAFVAEVFRILELVAARGIEVNYWQDIFKQQLTVVD